MIGDRLQFFSLADLLDEGAAASELAIVELARQQRAALVVLDGFRGMRRFLQDSNRRSPTSCTRSGPSWRWRVRRRWSTSKVIQSSPPTTRSLTVCDTMISLQRQTLRTRHRRVLDVVKHRGAMPLSGLHPFTLDQAGMTRSTHASTESLALASPAVDSDEQADFGIPAIDTLLGGGFTGTTTLMGWQPGDRQNAAGAALHRRRRGHRSPACFWASWKTPSSSAARADVRARPGRSRGARGVVLLLTVPGYDWEAERDRRPDRPGPRATRDPPPGDRLGQRTGRGDLATPERQTDFVAALVAYLRGRDVTTYVTTDLTTIVGPQLQFADTPLSVLAENLLLVRYAEYGGQLHRLLSVIKMRFSDYDRSLYEYTITSGRGIELLGNPPVAYGLLSGQVQLVPVGAPGTLADAREG